MVEAQHEARESADGLRADLVLEGGGVKGVALAGAVTRLAAAGYRFPRIAGTSAGSIIGAVTAALQLAGEPLDYLRDVAMSMDYRRLADRSPAGRLAGPLTPAVDFGSLLLDRGIYRGDALHAFVTDELARFGVRTFGDLRLVMLPWEYEEYGLDPDEQSVADAVRMSASLPFFYEPVTLRTRYGESCMIDGGLLSNYPIDAFDRTDERPPRWPTFGVKLSPQPPRVPETREVGGVLSYALAIADTVLTAHDWRNVDEPAVRSRTIFVDTGDVEATDFGIDEQTRTTMLQTADQATRDFLSRWDFTDYRRQHRGENR